MATIRDVAKRSGVSAATVSYVINNGPRPVLPETRERVLKVIAECNYRPNAAALGLMGKRTNTFGVVFPHMVNGLLDNAYFLPILAGIIDTATEQQKLTMLYTGVTWEGVEETLPVFYDGRCDGFVFIAPDVKSNMVIQLSEAGRKIVVVGTRFSEVPVPVVDCDNVGGARMAVRYLASLGHRRIAHIKNVDTISSCPEREAGFIMEHSTLGLPVDQSLIVSATPDPYDAATAARALLSLPENRRPTAIFCSNDMIGDVVYHQAYNFGLRIPEDLSVVGFDDVSFAATMAPPMTTIRQPLRELGAGAASLLLNLIDGATNVPQQNIFNVQLIERLSAAPPRRLD